MPTPSVLEASADPEVDLQHLAELCRLHAEHQEDNKRMQASVRKLNHRLEQLQRESSALQSEQARSVLTRSQLEALCRQLQAQNRAIKEEGVVRAREECEKRRTASVQFQSTLSEIAGAVADGSQKNARLTEENASIARQLSELCQKYEQKNKEAAALMEQRDVQTRQSVAQLAQAHLEMKHQRSQLTEEKQQLLEAVGAQKAQYKALQAADSRLRAQLETYSTRFDKIQRELASSNGTFDSYKSEMARMQETISWLEGESASWRQKCAANNQALLRMAQHKQTSDVVLATQRRRLETLQRLHTALESRAGPKISEAVRLETATSSAAQYAVGSVTQPSVNGGTQSTVDVTSESVAENGTHATTDSSRLTRAPEVSDVRTPDSDTTGTAADTSAQATSDSDTNGASDSNAKATTVDTSAEATTDTPSTEAAADSSAKATSYFSIRAAADSSSKATSDSAVKTPADSATEAVPDSTVGPVVLCPARSVAESAEVC
ncbi:alpha-taxilin-like [Amphibalanus amphitrite]|uniref:alpha-taxilin-like n=1 Tax=Amphibalanus amphitrite TaxID=1232801 RepID=UPI001C90CF64|nr:alpha-taxilin-like [Amphibalanus amphitrite]XP_043225840.1 alpha-taxilin-like [Amphibalanus amphitrite]